MRRVDRRSSRVARAALLLPLAGLLSGCGGRAGGAVVLHVASWGKATDDQGFQRTLDALYREFERANPGVRIEQEIVPDQYVQKMVMDHVAGVSPDVMMLDASSAAVFIDDGLLTDLDPFIRRDPSFRLDDFFPNTVAIGRRGAAIYAIPQDFTPMALYYDRSKFDAAGVKYPTGAWSFEDFRRAALRLSDPARGRYGFVFTSWMPGWVTWLWNAGGAVLSPDGKRAEGWLDAPGNARTLGFLRDLVERDRSAPSPSQTSSMGVDPFADGEAAMTISGHWSLIDYKASPVDPATGRPALDWRELGVAPLPHDTPASRTVLYEAGYALPVGCGHPELAWRFVRFMTSRAAQLRYNATGIAIDARKDVAAERAADPLEREFLALVPEGRAPLGSQVVGYDFVEAQGMSAMNSILENGASPAVALRRAARRIDAEFAKR